MYHKTCLYNIKLGGNNQINVEREDFTRNYLHLINIGDPKKKKKKSISRFFTFLRLRNRIPLILVPETSD